jgi:hypothetical protein
LDRQPGSFTRQPPPSAQPPAKTARTAAHPRSTAPGCAGPRSDREFAKPRLSLAQRLREEGFELIEISKPEPRRVPSGVSRRCQKARRRRAIRRVTNSPVYRRHSLSGLNWASFDPWCDKHEAAFLVARHAIVCCFLHPSQPSKQRGEILLLGVVLVLPGLCGGRYLPMLTDRLVGLYGPVSAWGWRRLGRPSGSNLTLGYSLRRSARGGKVTFARQISCAPADRYSIPPTLPWPQEHSAYDLLH